MKKFLIIIFISILIPSTLSSQCTDKMAIETKIVDTSSSGGDSPDGGNNPSGGDSPDGGNNPSGPDSPDDGNNPSGPDSPDGGNNPSGPDSPDDGNNPNGPDSPDGGNNPNGPDSPDGGNNPNGPDSPDGGDSPGNRRLLSQLTENDCKNLKTSNDNKYQCILSSDKSKCLEDEKNISYHIKLSFVILSILFLI